MTVRLTDCGADIFGQSLYRGSMDSFWSELLLKAKSTPCSVVTINVDHVIRMKKSPDYKETVSRFSIRTIDGMPLLWLVKKLDQDFTWSRITGADLLIQSAGIDGVGVQKILVLGGAPGVAESAAEELNTSSRHDYFGIDPGVIVGDDLGQEVLDAVYELDPDIVFVCLGSPKQENIILKLAQTLSHGLLIGAGAAVDFAAGNVRRAPLWIQRLGVEWVWRLCQEPKRLARRYLLDSLSFIEVIYSSLRKR